MDYSTFTLLGALYQEMAAESKTYKMNVTEVSSSTYSRKQTSTVSHRLAEPIVISDINLGEVCTRNEGWMVFFYIFPELKEYNALWATDQVQMRNNSSYRAAVHGLRLKGILIRTATRGIYIVNPRYIRRGDPFAVTATTASLVYGKKPDRSMIHDCFPTRTLEFQALQLPSSSSVQRGAVSGKGDQPEG